jgi:predicted O-linked N-acetylglucosamine transferase (SPINDLY family)
MTSPQAGPLLAAAVAAHRAGRFAEAEQAYGKVLALEPANTDALHLLGVAVSQQGRHQEAVEYLGRAVAACPAVPAYHNNLGMAWHGLEALDRAEASFRQALALEPRYAQAHNNLGLVLRDRLEFDAARACFARACELQPDYADAWNNLGNALQELGRTAEAMAHYRRAIAIAPDLARAYNNLGTALQDQELHDEAIGWFRRALGVQPTLAAALENLGVSLKSQGRPDEAAASLRQAMAIEPRDSLRYELATVLPVICPPAEEISRLRQRLVETLTAMVREGVQLDPGAHPLGTLFYLAYHGLNDRPVHELVGRLCAWGSQDWTAGRRPSATGRIRVGFVSRFFRDHTIGRLWQETLARLSRERFEVVVLAIAAHDDPVAQRIQSSADRYVVLPRHPGAARRKVAQEQLDVLVFTDVGMEPVSFALAASRLAPVQCAAWGHPVTTGLPTIDYFLSSDALETASSAEHYTERLVRFRSLGLYLEQPALTVPGGRRADFGLREDRHLYGCLQSLFKLHPDDDAQFAAILRADPAGEVVLLGDRDSHWARLVLRRMADTLADLLPRVRFVPPQAHDDFLRLTSLMDVMLDPLHFGGGRTSYEALALGVPVVTLPSELLRGRITYAIYRRMGVDACVAADRADYVRLAVRLGGDAEQRAAVSRQIRAGCGRFFGDVGAVGELEDFLQSAARGRV